MADPREIGGMHFVNGPRHRLTIWLVSLVTVAGLGLAAVVGPAPLRGRAVATVSNLSVSGNHLVDNGRTVVLHGVNRSGSEYACWQGWGFFDGASDDASVAAIAAWSSNAVRVPLNEDCWLGINGVTAAYSGANYRSAITSYVSLLRQHGLYVQLSLQVVAPGTAQSTAILPMPDADPAGEFLRSVGNTFAGDHGVIFDLYNEPHDIDWTCWADGCPISSGTNVSQPYQAVGFKALVSAIRGSGAGNVILIPGTGWSYDLSGWLANRPNDSQLVAGVHNYGGPNYNTQSSWEASYAPTAAQVPVTFGEIGFDGYVEQLMPWLDSHGIGYLAWTWDTWGTDEALISGYDGTPTTYGVGYRSHLLSLTSAPAPAPTPTPTVTPTPTPSPTPSPGLTPSGNCPAASTVPCFDHIFIVLMENHAYSEIVGSSQAPYFNQLAQRGTLAGNYFAVDHPSLPNYIALTSGDDPSWATPDCAPVPGCTSSRQNLADKAEASGRSWKGYMESMGAACGTSDNGSYAVRHDPWVYYDDIRNNAARCTSHVVDYTALATDLASAATTPNLVWITPNLCDDMHDCSIQTGDGWLSREMPKILNSPAFTSQRSLLAVVWDEDDSAQGNQVPLALVGSGVRPAFVPPTSYNHYNLLRTVEAAWGLPTLTANDGGAAAMADAFGAGAPTPTPTPNPTPTPTPTPKVKHVPGHKPKPTPTPTPTVIPTG